LSTRKPGFTSSTFIRLRPEESRADDEHQRDRHLGRDDDLAQALAASRQSASAFDEVPAQIPGHRARGGERAEPGGDGRGQHEREREDGNVDRNAVQPRQIRRRQRDEQGQTLEREEHTHRAARDRQEQRFGEELTDKPTARRAERAAHRELALAQGEPREHQVRDVRARDEQQKPDCAEQDQQRRSRFARDRFLKGDDESITEEVVALLARFVMNATRDRADVAIRLLDGHAVTQARDRPVVVRRPARIPAAEIGRHPELDFRRKVESGRQHADHREARAVDLQVNLREIARRSEVLTPVSVADEHSGRGALGPVLGHETATDDRPHAEHLEKVGRHPSDDRARRRRCSRYRRDGSAVLRNRLEAAVLVAEVVEVGIRQGRRPALRRDLEDGDDPIGIGVRQRPQQHAVDDAE
jgi:hypothetical protein